MREIKFRAYYQRFSDDVWIIEGEYTLRDLTDRGIQFDQERIRWVEFTGLKDKNGEEIYEGDIVDIYRITHDTKETIKRELWFTRGVKISINGVIFGQLRYSSLVVNVDDIDFEIIGNIYENPELLGD